MNDPSKQVHVVAHLTGQPAQILALAAVLKELARGSREEAGNLGFFVPQNASEPARFVKDSSLQKLLGQKGLDLIPIAKVATDDLIREKKLIVLGKLDGIFEEIWLMSARRKVDNPIAASLMNSF